MDEYFFLKIMTPDEIFFEGKARMLELPSKEGRIGVEKGHMPLAVLLDRGEIDFREKETARSVGAEVGFAVITGSEVRIWTRTAFWRT